MFDGAVPTSFFYILKPVRVADRIVAAIQQEEPLVLMPWRGNIILLLKCFPVSIQSIMLKLLGANKSMNDFKGRGGIESRIPGIKK